ncbi:MAG TPA: hypothetical protein VGD04_09520 [Methylophilus sp.]
MLHSPYAKATVKQGLLHFLLGRGLAGVAGFVTVILMARFMDIQQYAGFTALTGVIAFGGILASLGLERAISRYVPELRLSAQPQALGRFILQLSFIRLCASLVVVAGLYLFWQPLLSVFNDVQLPNFPLALACFVLAEALFQHFSCILQALLQQKSLTGILVIQWAGRLLMLYWAILADHGLSLEEALWMMALPEMLGVLAFVVMLYNYLAALNKDLNAQHMAQNSLAPHLPTPAPSWRAIMAMSLNNYGFTLLAAPPQGYFMKMIAAIFLPTETVAAYGFFISIAEKARQYIPLHFFYNLIEPVLVAQYLKHQDFTKLTRYCQWLYKSNLLLLIPAIAWIAVAGTQVIGVMTAGKFQQELWILLLVMVQLTIGSHIVLLQLLLNSVGKSHVLIQAGAVALAGMLFYWATVPLIAKPLLLCGPLVFSLICNIAIIRKLNNSGLAYGVPWPMVANVAVAGVLAYLLAFVVSQEIITTITNATVSAAVSLGVIAMAYLLALALFKVIRAEELDFFKSMMKKN